MRWFLYAILREHVCDWERFCYITWYTIDFTSIECILRGVIIQCLLVVVFDVFLNIGNCLDISWQISDLFINDIFSLFELHLGVNLMEIEFILFLWISWRCLALQLLVLNRHLLNYRTTIVVCSTLNYYRSTSLWSLNCCNRRGITFISHHRSGIDLLVLPFVFTSSWLGREHKLFFLEFRFHGHDFGGVCLVSLIISWIFVILS